MKHIVLTAVICVLALSANTYSQDQTGDDITEAAQSDNKAQSDSRDRHKSDHDGKNDSGNLSRRAMRVIDTNDDRKVSIEEYMAHAQQRFVDVDTDGDNFITPTEAKAASKAMREKQDEAKSFLSTMKERFTGDSESTKSD